MGEGTNSWIKVDPAVLRWAEMRESVPKYFRFTRATVWTGIACLVIFPVTCQLMTIWSTRRWDIVGKRRGELVNIADAEKEKLKTVSSSS